MKNLFLIYILILLIIPMNNILPDGKDDLYTGLFGLKIYAEVSYIPPASKQFCSLHGTSTNRILIHDRTLEGYYVNINSFDFGGNLATTISGIIECKVPFYFENAS